MALFDGIDTENPIISKVITIVLLYKGQQARSSYKIGTIVKLSTLIASSFVKPTGLEKIGPSKANV